MNASDVLKYGHLTVLKSVEGLPETHWSTPGVCGYWSVKDILAHLASYEWVLVDILATYVGGGPTPRLEKYTAGPGFNDDEVALRRDHGPAQIMDEYCQAQARTMTLIAQIPAETIRQPGTQPWYGLEYALDDLIAYMYYGHKREHTAQIAVFRDTLR
jgi:hypothetical protein